MADLPANRCAPSDRAFSSVGVDLFGPFLVKQGRSVIKRYGCIFRCIRSRAVHLEILNSMEADSFINALVRFSARRGRPVEVLSDKSKAWSIVDLWLRSVMIPVICIPSLPIISSWLAGRRLGLGLDRMHLYVLGDAGEEYKPTQQWYGRDGSRNTSRLCNSGKSGVWRNWYWQQVIWWWFLISLALEVFGLWDAYLKYILVIMGLYVVQRFAPSWPL